MADNKNAEAVKFSNERARVLADALRSAYLTSKIVLAEWYARDLGTIFKLEDRVVDGAETDGRHPVTGNEVALIITRAAELVADYEKDNNAKLNTVLAIAVNGQSKV